MEDVLNYLVKIKGSRSKMYKLILLVIVVGGFVFAGSLNITAKIDVNSNPVKNQYLWVEDTSDDDYKVEAGRRRGKGGRGDRRRGGGGLR